MSKQTVKVNIEEHLNKTLEIEIPDDMWNLDCLWDYIYAEVKRRYQNEEIVLDADDYNGVTLISIDDSEYFEL